MIWSSIGLNWCAGGDGKPMSTGGKEEGGGGRDGIAGMFVYFRSILLRGQKVKYKPPFVYFMPRPPPSRAYQPTSDVVDASYNDSNRPEVSQTELMVDGLSSPTSLSVQIGNKNSPTA